MCVRCECVCVCAEYGCIRAVALMDYIYPGCHVAVLCLVGMIVVIPRMVDLSLLGLMLVSADLTPALKKTTFAPISPLAPKLFKSLHCCIFPPCSPLTPHRSPLTTHLKTNLLLVCHVIQPPGCIHRSNQGWQRFGFLSTLSEMLTTLRVAQPALQK